MEKELDCNYLGVTYSRAGVFLKAAKQAVSKSNVADSDVRKICGKAKCTNCETKKWLQDAFKKKLAPILCKVIGLEIPGHAGEPSSWLLEKHRSTANLPRTVLI